jgi:hypothetical protein
MSGRLQTTRSVLMYSEYDASLALHPLPQQKCIASWPLRILLTQKILHAAIPSDAVKNLVADGRHVAQAFDIGVGECRFLEGLVEAIDLVTLEGNSIWCDR